MKTLMWSLAAILSLALSSIVVAAGAKDQQVSGVVVECDDFVLVIKDSKKERLTFNPKFLGNQRYQPKVGDNVTVHWEIGRHGAWWAYKVDKIENGSKKD
jgi:hypothetical protein